MSTLPPCPKCQSEYTYEDADQLVCPECGHEWKAGSEMETTTEDTRVIKDANGAVLADGDTVTVIKDLKVKGSSLVVKVGTRYATSVWSMAITTLTARSTASAR